MTLTLDDLRGHLNMTALPPDGDVRRRELQRALDTATQELTRMTGRLNGVSAVARVPGGGYPLRLPYVDLASIGPVLDPSGVAVACSAVDLVAGLVWATSTTAVGGAWAITCTGSAWPSALESAALDWAAHVYDTQRTTLNPTADDGAGLPSFALPSRVAQFAAPYLLPGFA